MSKRIKGLYTDAKPIDQPEGTYRNLTNGVINREIGALVDEKGNEFLSSIATDGQVIGSVSINNNEFILFVKVEPITQSLEGSIVYYWDGSFLHTIFEDLTTNEVINFNLDYPIQAEYTVDEDDDTIIIFTDGLNPIRFINLSKWKEDNEFYSDISNNIDKISLIPVINESPILNDFSIIEGGSLKTGAYSFFISYQTDDETETNRIQISPWISISNSFRGASYFDIDGDEGGLTTSKAIQLEISSLDTSYRRFHLYVVHKENNQITSSVRVDARSFSKNETITYNGSQGSSIDVSLDEILVNTANYSSAKAITKVDDHFYFGGLKRNIDVGYQKYANNIEVELVEKSLSAIGNESTVQNSFKLPAVRDKFKSYMGDDVYAIYVSFILKDGSESLAYHIPGRQPLIDPNDTTTDGSQATGSTTVINPSSDSSTSCDSSCSTSIPPGGAAVKWLGIEYCIEIPNSSIGTIKTVVINFINSCLDELEATNLTGDEITIRTIENTDQFNNEIVSLLIPTDIEGSGNIFSDYFIELTGGSSESTSSNAELTSDLPEIDSTHNIYSDAKSIVDPDGSAGIEPKAYEFSTGSSTLLTSNGMGFWENDNETYPVGKDWEVWDVDSNGDGFKVDTLTGANVRHHRFPSTVDKPIFTTSGHILGFQLKNFKIPNDIAKKVKAVKVYRAKRNNNNKLVLGMGDIHPVQEKTWNGQDFFVQTAKPTENTSSTVNYTGLDFHLLRTKENIGSLSYIKTIAFNDLLPADVVIDDTINKGAKWTHNNAVNVYNHRDSYTNVTSLNNANYIKNLIGKGFIENNKDIIKTSNLGFTKDFSNSAGNSAIALKIENGLTNIVSSRVVKYLSYKKDLYNNFFNQQLQWTGYLADSSNFEIGGSHQTSDIWGGDTYIGNLFLKRSWGNFTNDPQNLEQVHIHHHVVANYDNVAMRHESDNINDRYYPKSNLTDTIFPTGKDTKVDEIDNFYSYSEEYGTVETLKPSFPFNSEEQDINIFHERVARTYGEKQQYRFFKENDHTSIPGEGGKVINLENFNNLLFIHAENGLYRTYGREELSVADIRAFVGAGDIFANKPTQVYEQDSGYAGLQDPRHAVICKYGYFFVDSKAGKVFQLSGKFNEIHKKGMRVFFRDKINHNYRLGYNPHQETIVVTYNDGTVSFLPDMDVWMSFHTYQSNYYLNTRANLISFNDGGIYAHDRESSNTFYGITYPFIFTFVDNRSPQTNKRAVNIEYTFHLENPNGYPIKDKTFDTFQIKNSYQDSGEQPIIYFKNQQGNARFIRNKWFINRFRDLLDENNNIDSTKPWYQKNKLVDNFFIVTLKYNNSDDNSLYLYDEQVNVKPYRS